MANTRSSIEPPILAHFKKIYNLHNLEMIPTEMLSGWLRPDIQFTVYPSAQSEYISSCMYDRPVRGCILARWASHHNDGLIVRPKRCFASSEYCIYSMGPKNGLLEFGYNSTESEPIWMKSGILWAKCWGLALAVLSLLSTTVLFCTTI